MSSMRKLFINEAAKKPLEAGPKGHGNWCYCADCKAHFAQDPRKKTPKMESVFHIREAGLPSGTKDVTLNQVKTDMKKNMDMAVKNIANASQKGGIKIKQTPSKPNDPTHLTGGYVTVDNGGNVSELDPTTGQLQNDPNAGSMNQTKPASSMDPGSMNI